MYVKNKYLYMFTEGAINYLEAYRSMEKNTQDWLGDLETTILKEVIINEIQAPLNIVSIGAATSEKEISVLKIFSDLRATYFPIDVSPYLTEIGIIKAQNALANRQLISIEPIMADFWDLADTPRNTIPFHCNDRRNIFTFFGGTIGNYHEVGILEAIEKLMNYDDYLIMGFETWDKSKQIHKEIQRVFDEYNTIDNLQFLLEPLYHVPRYSGYIQRFNKYFKFRKEEALVYEPDELGILSAVPDVLCYAPYIEIPTQERNILVRDTEDIRSSKIRLAQTTKYCCDELKNWINNSLRYLSVTSLHNKPDYNCGVLVMKKIEEEPVAVDKPKIKPPPIDSSPA